MMSSLTAAYLYGSLSVFVICLLSISGALVVPLIRNNGKARWMQIFIAMAVATLSTDAMLHLIPEALGLHKHDSGGHVEKAKITYSDSQSQELHFTLEPPHTTGNHEDEHSNEHDSEHGHEDEHSGHEDEHGDEHGKKDEHGHGDEHSSHEEEEGKIFHWKMCAILACMYFLYIFEFCAKWATNGKNKAHNHNHLEHGHGTLKAHSSANNVSPVLANGGPAWDSRNDSYSVNNKMIPKGEEQPQEKGNSFADQTPICFGFKPIALIILFGDAIHNFADGVAIGASFSAGLTSGLSTTVAVACHELPHEIGDFAVLVDSGLSMKKALLMNFISALTAFIGLFVGISVGEDGEARTWLFALAAAMFLYVAWIDMIHHLKDEEQDDPWYLTIALQNVGFIIGFVILFLLAWFEDDIYHIFH